MRLKKLIYSIAATSIITPVAIDSFIEITVQASTVSNDTAVKYSYETACKIEKREIGADFINHIKHGKYNKGYILLSYKQSNKSRIYFKINKHHKIIHVGVTVKSLHVNGNKYVKVSKEYYKAHGIKRNYTYHGHGIL